MGNTGGKWAIGQGGDAGGLFRHQFLFRILSMILRAPFQIVLLQNSVAASLLVAARSQRVRQHPVLGWLSGL